MEKIKLAICMKDLEYQNRFVNCFMDHYKHQYELHVFTNLDQLKNSKPLEYAVIITGEYSTEELAGFVERGEILLSLEEYQEVYKIEEQVGRLAASNERRDSSRKGIVNYKKTGVYSLAHEYYQVPFAVLLAKQYSKEKVLVLDLQSYSGLQEKDDVSVMGLEDLLSVAMTGKYSKGRLLESVHHAPDFDYVSPVQTNQCLAEGTDELFSVVMDILAKELGYERFIINFGTVFSGQITMMEQCEELYLLRGKEQDDNWREEAFYRELKNLEKDKLLQNIKKLSISAPFKAEPEWRTLVERWNFGQVGETLRHMMRKEYVDGTAM